MGNRGDILVHSDDFKLIVRVKGGGESSADLAAQYRYNLIEHELIPKTEYFMLAYSDYLYLWKEKNILETVPPDYIVRTFNVLKKYLTTSDTEPKLVIKQSLRMALSYWLSTVAFSAERPPVGSDAYKLLVESGLLDTIAQREVISEIN